MKRTAPSAAFSVVERECSANPRARPTRVDTQPLLTKDPVAYPAAWRIEARVGNRASSPERLSGGGPNPSDGMAAVDLSINLRDVTDGSSNTFLILELSRNAEHSWVAKNTGSNQFMWTHHPSQGLVTAGELSGSSPPFPPNSNFPNSRGAVGGHPGGINVAFADGHVQFIKNSINFQIYRALFSRNIGEVVSADSY